MIVLTFRSEHLHLVTYQRGGEGCAPVPDNWWANLTSVPPITDIVPLPLGREDWPPCSAHCLSHTMECFTWVRSPIQETTDVSAADSGFTLQSWSWISIGLAGLWGAAQHWRIGKKKALFSLLKSEVKAKGKATRKQKAVMPIIRIPQCFGFNWIPQNGVHCSWLIRIQLKLLAIKKRV